MTEGIYSFFPCCSSRLEAAMQGMSWTKSDHYSFNVMLDASLNQFLETAFNGKIISNLLYAFVKPEIALWWS
jgi:hypothetical protein